MAADWIDARAAAELLGVKRETLYAYVSRGLVRARPTGSGKTRVYRRADLERLRARSRARSGHGAAAASALRWGEPVLDSAITLIEPAGPRYRGTLAVELARTRTFEAVAELLWHGELPERAPKFEPVTAGARLDRLRRTAPEDALAAMRALVALAPPSDEELAAPALIRLLACAPALSRGQHALRRSLAARSVAEALLAGLGRGCDANAVRAVNQALILSADHELNPSSFTARVAASVGASLSQCTLAALSTFSGPLHGGACSEIERFVRRIGRPEAAIGAVSAELAANRSPPGFGHPLYPAGDPRALPLLALAQALAPERPAVRTLHALAGAVELATGEHPTIDFGLVALCAALDLPPGSPTALFAVGRSAGWIAHALEQREQGFVLRPRARYAAAP